MGHMKNSPGGGKADTTPLKGVDRKVMRVRIPLWAPKLLMIFVIIILFSNTIVSIFLMIHGLYKISIVPLFVAFIFSIILSNIKR